MNRLELIKTLEVVGRGLTNNNIVPMFGYFCFTGTEVFAGNDVVWIVAPCKVEKPFGCHGAILLGLLKNSKGDEVDIKVTDECLLIKVGSSEFKLPYVGPDQFVWKEPNDSDYVERFEVLSGIEKCMATCSPDVALGAFNQICLGANGGEVYSSNGDAITKALTEVGPNTYEPVCLSREFCQILVKVLNCDDEIGVIFFVGPEWVMGSSDECGIYGRNLGPPTLDYEKEIKQSVGSLDKGFVAIPRELDAALSRARVVADAETKPSILDCDGKELAIITDTDLGNVDDVMLCSHPATQAKVSAALLQSSLEGCTDFKITENCIVLKGERVLRVIGNM